MAQNRQDMGSGPVKPLLLQLMIPAVVAQVVNLLYNIVDRIYIGHIEGIGAAALTGVGLFAPILMLLNAFAMLIGAGGAPRTAIALGQGNKDEAEKIIGNSFTMLLFFAVVLTAGFYAGAPALLRLFGASDATLPYAVAYGRIYILGSVFVLLVMGMNPFITTQGFAKISMLTTVIGAVINIILDPIFIFPCGWGMMGAAVATVLGQLLTAVMAVYYLFHMRSVKLEKASFRLCGSVIKRFIPLGICSFLAQISLVAAMAATNNMIRKYGALDPVFGLAEYAQIPMAVVGIVMKFFQIIMSVCIGMAAGCIPIVGYNMGAEKYGRVRGLFTRLLICEAAAGAIATLIVELFPTGLIAIFGAANESAYYTEFAVKCFRIYLCMMPLACVNKAAFIFLQAMGKAVASTALSMIREIVFGVGLVLVLPLVWWIDGVVLSMPAADILAFIASAIVIIYTYRTLKKDESRKLA